MHEENEWFERWERILGLLWFRDDVPKMQGGESEGEAVQQTTLDRIRFPLALLVKPDLFKEVTDRFGIDTGQGKPGAPHVPSNAISMGALSKEDFLTRMGVSTAKVDQEIASPRTQRKGEPIPQGFKETTPRKLGP